MGILFELGKELVKTLEDGALDTDQVWVQFICQTGPAGEHDPDDDPDDHVRPSHAAFHGQVFKMADAPIPPLDYGCRCAIRYVAKPASDAEKVLDVVAPTDDTTTATDATKGWLTNNVPGWPSLAKIALEAKPKEAIGLVQQAAKAAKIAEPRQVAEMVVDVAKAEPKATAEVAAAPKPAPAAPPAAAPPEAPAAPAAPAPPVAETPAGAPATSLAKLPKQAESRTFPVLKPEVAEANSARSKKLVDALDQEQKNGIMSYTGGYYAHMRDIDSGMSYEQFAKEHPGESRGYYEMVSKDVENVNSAFKAVPLQEVDVAYRGLKNVARQAVLNMLRDGRVVTAQMSSASYDPFIAGKFATEAFSREGRVPVVIRFLKVKGLLVERLGIQSEHELLLPKGAEFKVVSAVRTTFAGRHDVIMVTVEAT